MSERTPARAVRRTRPLFLAALAAVSATLVAVLVACQSAEPSDTSSAAPSVDTPQGDRQGGRGAPAPALDDGRLDRAGDGSVPDGVTVFDDTYPAVANLDAELLSAVREAAIDAADDGVAFYVNSGWRSAEYQEQLLREAVAEYGSEEEAARWVATAETSPHVSGDAIDLGDSDATAWLSDHGAAYGLCQIYENEPWHYELHPEAEADGCPTMYADPTHDPRMQQ